MEVLEHVPDPRAVLGEMARVASSWILASVPREPLWRGLNLARGAYLRSLGNTPGHLNHWSTASFVKFVSRVATVRAVEKPFPWTIVWAELPS